MRKASFIFFLLIFFLACSDEHKVPKGILKQEKMQAVIWDMVRAGEFLNSFIFTKDSNIDKTARSLEMFDTIYHIHNVTRAEFEKSYDYYKDHPVLMQELMDSLGKKHSKPEKQESEPVPPSLPDTTGKKDILHENRAGAIVIDSIRRKPLKEVKRR